MSRTTVVGRDGVTPSGTRSWARDWWSALWADPVMLALAVLIALSAVGTGTGTGAGAFTAQVVLVWTIMTALHFGLVVLAWQVRTLAVPGRGVRRMWTGLAVAGVVFFLGDLDQLRLIARGPITVDLAVGAPFQALGALAGSAVIVLAMLLVPTGPRTSGGRVRNSLDLAVVMAGTVGVCVYTYQPSPGVPGFLALLIGPGVYIVGVFAVVRLILAVEPPFTTWAGIAAGGAAGVEALAFVLGTPLIDRGHLSWVFGLNVIASSLLTASARLQQRRMLARTELGRRRRRYSYAPYGAIATTNALLCWSIAALRPSAQVWVIVLSAVVATALVVVRQLAAFTENARLLEELDRRVGELHLALTEREQLAAQLRHQAFHDPLTGLGNRALLAERLERALATDRSPGQMIALIVLDLDGFKQVNDVYGHAAGDELLMAAAERLRRDVGDGALVARLGGDEFAVLIEDAIEGERLAGRLVTAMTEPYSLFDDVVAAVSASIGMVVCSGSGHTSDRLLHEADAAMYEAKHAGKRGFRVREVASHRAP